MIWLSSGTISRLRDQLLTRGQRPSLVLEPGLTPDAIEMQTIMAEYGPLCEAMVLMMSADGSVSEDEQNVLKGALRNLSGDTLRSHHTDSLILDAKKQIAAMGREARMEEVIASLQGDEARAEVTFVLAAAVAFADNAIADEENDVLNALAEGLGIDETRANELLDSMDRDLKGDR